MVTCELGLKQGKNRSVEEMLRKIVQVPRTERHTLVVRNGSRMKCLRFNETITGVDLRRYLEGQFGWKIEGLQMTVDGTTFKAEESDLVNLAPSTGQVDYDEKPSAVEFRRPMRSKG